MVDGPAWTVDAIKKCDENSGMLRRILILETRETKFRGLGLS